MRGSANTAVPEKPSHEQNHLSFPAAFFDTAPKLRGYANYAVGFDNIDVPEATRRDIPVSNTPGEIGRAHV